MKTPNIRPAVSMSEFSRSMRKFRRHRMANIGLVVLVLFYAAALLADFIAPYHYDNERRDLSYCPPTRLHWVDGQGKFHWRPFVYTTKYEFDEYYNRVYVEDPSRSYPVTFFCRGDRGYLFGIIPCSYHLYGVETPARCYLTGADSRGRDLFSRICFGSRVSLSIGLFGVMISFLIGLVVGGISGFWGGKVDTVLMRVCEMVMLVPGFYLMLALRAAFPPELSSVKVYLLIVVILSFIGWAGLARVIRGMVLAIRQKEFVVAAVALGNTDFKVLLSHVLPQTLSYVIVASTLAIPAYILGESGLSLIGLGIQDPNASWGNLLAEAMNIADIRFHPWILLPGFFIFATVMSFNFVGDGLRDAFDPKTGE